MTACCPACSVLSLHERVRGRGGQHREMANGGTAVFVDALALAVSALAHQPWHFRFAALLTLQDQNVMGRGVVGFGLAELDGAIRRRTKPRPRTSCFASLTCRSPGTGGKN